MMCKPHRWCLWLIAVLCCGCFGSIPSTAYYTLQAAPEPVAAAKNPQTANLTIGIGPVTLPRHLDRDAIVTRISPNRLRVNENSRWAGSLHSDILRVLSAHMENLPQVKEVVVFPWATSIEPDLRFRVEILAFEGRPGQTVTLQAAWTMAPGSSDQPAVRRVALIEEKTQGDSMEEMVAAMARALNQLGRQMGEAITKARP
jgi:uncharacterized lipoprotein YmbA